MTMPPPSPAAERSWESVATALINLALGITIGSLPAGTARSSTQVSLTQ